MRAATTKPSFLWVVRSSKKIREALVSDERATGEGATVKVYPQEGMSEETIGRVAAEEFNWMLRRKMR